MARQEGQMKITGTMGNFIYFRRGDKYFVKLKPHVDPKHLTKNPGSERQRQNMMEFGRAGKAGKLIFLAFATSHYMAKDMNLCAHLLREAHKVIKSDNHNAPGQRNVTDGETTLMEGFEFNENAPLRNVLISPFTASIDRATGVMSVTIHELNLQKMVKAPAPATHFMIQIAGASLDFVHQQHVSEVTHSPEFPLKGSLPEQLSLSVQLPRNNLHPLFLALRVSFLQEHNGVIKPLNTITHNAMAFVKVHGV